MGIVSHDSETPKHGQQVITAVAFIYKFLEGEARVLLAKRAKTKKFLPDKWEMLGGHIDFGEEIIEGMKREVLEELGISIDVGEPFEVFTYMNNVKGSHSIEVVYLAKFHGIDALPKIDPNDHSEVRWMTRSEVISERSNIIPEKNNQNINHQSETDPEYEAILKGFDRVSRF